MSDTKQITAKLFQVNLDGEIIALPWRSLKSVLGILEHFESLAKCQERNYGAVLKKRPAARDSSKTPKRQSEATCYRELGRQVIRTAQSQVRVLQGRTLEVQSLVLINNWGVAERLWTELLMGCKTPLFELNFLEELWGIKADRLEVEGWSLSRHWHQFVLIQAEVEIVLARRQNLMQLSDTLEAQLGTWLARFGEILEKLDEESLG